MCLEDATIACGIVIVAASYHRKNPSSIPRRGKCILLVATELAYKSHAGEGSWGVNEFWTMIIIVIIIIIDFILIWHKKP